jgi:hypothetical protein
MYRSPVDIYVDEWVYQLLDTVERVDARRCSSTASPTCSWCRRTLLGEAGAHGSQDPGSEPPRARDPRVHHRP